MSSTLDDLLASGGKSFKFENPGDTVTGTIAAIDVRQATEFGTGKPLTWDDGRPQEQIVVTLQTDLAEDGDDDGKRNVYVKGWGSQLRAFKAAAAAAGAKPTPGTTFTASFTGYGPKPAGGGFPSKEFEYRIVPASTARVDALTGPAPVPAPAVPPPATGTAPAASAGESPAEKAKQLIALGLTDDQIAAAVGLDAPVVAAIRAA